MVVAQKVVEIEPFKNRIYQSDYLHAWQKTIVHPSEREIIKKPALIKRIARKIFGYPASEENLEKIDSRFFKKRNY
jgi:hypothetical protein